MNLKPNAITYTTLIDAYCKIQCVEDALPMYDEMTVRGLVPDVVTYSCIMNGLCKSGKVEEAKSVFREMEEVGVVPNHFSYATLIDSLFKEGNAAFQGQMVVRGVVFDVVVYTALMDGLFKAGMPNDAENMFQLLLEESLFPTCITYSCIDCRAFQVGRCE